MNPAKHIPVIAVLLMLIIGICRSARCYEKRNVDNSCAIKDLNNTIIDCPTHCKRKKSHDVQVLLCADELEEVGDRTEEDKQKETQFEIHVCSEDLCNECAKNGEEKSGINWVLIVSCTVGGVVLIGVIILIFYIKKRCVGSERSAESYPLK